MSVWALATWSGLYEPVGRIGRHGHSFAQLSAAGSLASTPKRGGRDRPEQPPRRPGPRGPPPGRARFTVSPARLAACMGWSPPPADSPPPLVASVQGTRRLRSCLSLCPPSRRAADSRIRQWLALYGPRGLFFAK